MRVVSAASAAAAAVCGPAAAAEAGGLEISALAKGLLHQCSGYRCWRSVVWSSRPVARIPGTLKAGFFAHAAGCMHAMPSDVSLVRASGVPRA